ncbi:MAG TPA: hypothetical protein VIZ17_15305 [Acetobacteraceae bacterium]
MPGPFTDVANVTNVMAGLVPAIHAFATAASSHSRESANAHVGDGNLDTRVMSLDPIENGLRPKPGDVACCFVKYRIGNDHRDIRIEQVIETVGCCQGDERAGVQHKQGNARRGHASLGNSRLRAAAIRC